MTCFMFITLPNKVSWFTIRGAIYYWSCKYQTLEQGTISYRSIFLISRGPVLLEVGYGLWACEIPPLLILPPVGHYWSTDIFSFNHLEYCCPYPQGVTCQEYPIKPQEFGRNFWSQTGMENSDRSREGYDVSITTHAPYSPPSNLSTVFWVWMGDAVLHSSFEDMHNSAPPTTNYLPMLIALPSQKLIWHRVTSSSSESLFRALIMLEHSSFPTRPTLIHASNGYHYISLNKELAASCAPFSFTSVKFYPDCYPALSVHSHKVERTCKSSSTCLRAWQRIFQIFQCNLYPPLQRHYWTASVVPEI